MRVGSLFSGIGGFDLGLERAGMEIVWQVEIDDWCRRVLAKHWPNVTRYEDVKDVKPEELAPVDLICGGFPCQPHSKAGRRRGVEDDRWLWPEFARVIRGVRPRWVLVENVPGLLSVNSGRAFGEMVGTLASLGYRVEWDCIPASAVGAPHRRDRVWIVAHAHQLGDRRQNFSSETSRAAGDRSAGGSGRSGNNADSDRLGENTVRRLGKGAVADTETAGRVANARGFRLPDTDKETDRNTARYGVERSSDLADTDGPGCRVLGFAGLHSAKAQDWSIDPAINPPETQSFVGRVAHGIPDRIHRLRGLGNAVVPQLVEIIGRNIMEASA